MLNARVQPAPLTKSIFASSCFQLQRLKWTATHRSHDFGFRVWILSENTFATGSSAVDATTSSEQNQKKRCTALVN